ncbi:helix-turn-helix transcriptional regulator [Bacillus sp. UNC438CL73TsuS30]|uniref:helix-turn-helix transcriptional regulator n=1 Tax=Bacillus sp. UNC438CL73TsuS30 TaxID=1340434 RepID=UPI00047AFCBA|nr:WYL domain-containing protein [Bacillus sp. UNC438CL73TsuS30]
MLEPTRVYSFKKEGWIYSLQVNSVKSKSEYWLEIEGSDGQIEISEKVYSWDAAVHLLESHNWTKYEMESFHRSFFDMISVAKGRKQNKLKPKKYNAQQRVLEILKMLERNEIIHMENATKEFNVKNPQIQRDISALREFYQYSNKEINYVRAKKGYELNVKGDYFTIDDALIVLLFLYGSRALNKEELKIFSDKMIGLFSNVEQIKLREFFQSYLYHYKPVQEQNLFELFYLCFQAISERKIIKFTYTNNAGITNEREVIPYTISYHDGKFYLLASMKGHEDKDPRTWQLDRMEGCSITNQRFSSLTSDLKVGEYILKAVNMYGGDPQTVRLKVARSNLSFLKRKFPDVSISPTNDSEWYEARLEVLGIMGIELWILQQGPYVEVLEPLELRENVKKLIGEMYHMYYEASKV